MISLEDCIAFYGLAREPEIRERLRLKGRQTDAGRASKNCCESGNHCVQGRSERQKDQVAREQEICQQLPLKRSQGLSSRRRSIAQRAQYGRSATIHTRGNGMSAERLLRGTAVTRQMWLLQFPLRPIGFRDRVASRRLPIWQPISQLAGPYAANALWHNAISRLCPLNFPIVEWFGSRDEVFC